jgi:hypothetical protein
MQFASGHAHTVVIVRDADLLGGRRHARAVMPIPRLAAMITAMRLACLSACEQLRRGGSAREGRNHRVRGDQRVQPGWRADGDVSLPFLDGSFSAHGHRVGIEVEGVYRNTQFQRQHPRQRHHRHPMSAESAMVSRTAGPGCSRGMRMFIGRTYPNVGSPPGRREIRDGAERAMGVLGSIAGPSSGVKLLSGRQVGDLEDVARGVGDSAGDGELHRTVRCLAGGLLGWSLLYPFFGHALYSR